VFFHLWLPSAAQKLKNPTQNWLRARPSQMTSSNSSKIRSSNPKTDPKSVQISSKIESKTLPTQGPKQYKKKREFRQSILHKTARDRIEKRSKPLRFTYESSFVLFIIAQAMFQKRQLYEA